jgi:hypothetical protein
MSGLEACVAAGGRWMVPTSAGALVVVGAAASALINELDGGPGWWIATAAVVLLWAAGTALLAARQSRPRSRLGDGAVDAGGDIDGGVTTRTCGCPKTRPTPLTC